MAVVAPGLLYVHMPKSAGTWVTTVMQAENGARRLGGGHDPAWMVDDPRHRSRYAQSGRGPGGEAPWPNDGWTASRLVFGTVRAPARWYLSTYLHAMHVDAGREALAQYGGDPIKQLGVAWDYYREDFRDVLRGMLLPAGCEPVPERAGVVWSPDPAALDGLAVSPLGLYAWSVAYFFGVDPVPAGPPSRWAVDLLVDADHLYDVLPDVLGLSAARLSRWRPRNTAKDRRDPAVPYHPPADWFDDEMLSWVAEADGWLMDLMGYETPLGPAAVPALRCRTRALREAA